MLTLLLSLVLVQAPTTEARAREVVAALAAKDYAKIEATYSPDMKAALPAGALEASWSAAAAQFGGFESVLGVQVQPAGANQLALVSCRFVRFDLTLRLTFNAAGELANLTSGAPVSRVAWTAPDYINASAFVDRPITIHSGRFDLPGIVSVPTSPGPHPAIVLVSGSGPNDMDESLGPNRPFKDLAGGLASRGVIVLRFEKRTHKYGAAISDDPSTFTVKEEFIDDANAAVALLGTMSEVDKTRVFLAGHSEGGYLAPRMAAANPAIKGLIVIAGNVRPIEDAIVDQFHYQASLAGAVTPAIQQALDAVEAQRREITSPDLKPGMTVHLLQSTLPASYILDLRGYHPDQVAASLTIPMLVLQGERDYQVTMTDFGMWKAALGSHANVTLKSYPSLNHFLYAGTGPIAPVEYTRPGHVDIGLIGDIVAWCAK